MRHRNWVGLLFLLVGCAATMTGISRTARACGGGIVTVPAGGVRAGSQRIFLSLRAGGITEVVTEVTVPETGADWGVLIPLPAAPTIDPEPLAASALKALEAATAPHIYSLHPRERSGCSCLGATSGDSKAGGDPGTRGGVDAGPPVDIGPVTAVALTGDTGQAVLDWLSQNGFALPGGQEAVVDAYAGGGNYFIAVRRNQTVATGQPTTIGLHFSVAGDARALPLRFTALGADTELSFTVFVAAPTVIAPSAPFAELTLDALDPRTIKTLGYAAALRELATAQAGRAFVIEGGYSRAELSSLGVPTRLTDLIEPGATLTRLSAIVPVQALTQDVTFDVPHRGIPRRDLVVSRFPAPTAVPGWATAMRFGFAYVCACVVMFVRRRHRG